MSPTLGSSIDYSVIISGGLPVSPLILTTSPMAPYSPAYITTLINDTRDSGLPFDFDFSGILDKPVTQDPELPAYIGPLGPSVEGGGTLADGLPPPMGRNLRVHFLVSLGTYGCVGQHTAIGFEDTDNGNMRVYDFIEGPSFRISGSLDEFIKIQARTVAVGSTFVLQDAIVPIAIDARTAMYSIEALSNLKYDLSNETGVNCARACADELRSYGIPVPSEHTWASEWWPPSYCSDTDASGKSTLAWLLGNDYASELKATTYKGTNTQAINRLWSGGLVYWLVIPMPVIPPPFVTNQSVP
jgi:hypothetical protein